MIVALTLLAVLVQAPAPADAPQPPAPVVDPATVSFATDVGLLLVAIKPDKTADYEEAVAALQHALSAATDPERRRMAQGWRVYKASEVDAKGNVLYVHALLPVVPGADYRLSRLLEEMVQGLPADALERYRDTFAAPPSMLSLTELANMALAPIRKEP